MQIVSQALQRNGVGGEPFYAVTFTDNRETFVAIITSTEKERVMRRRAGLDVDESQFVECFALSIDRLPNVGRSDGPPSSPDNGGNSWRGDLVLSKLLDAGLWEGEEWDPTDEVD